MATYLILDDRGAVLNRVEWDGASEWAPPPGTTLILEPEGGYVQPDLRTLDEAKAEAYARVTDGRYAAEIGGTTWNGWPVQTDRESRGTLLAEFVAVSGGIRADGDPYKFADGEFRALTNQQFMAMTMAVRNYVRACYGREAVAQAHIAAATTNAEADAVAF